MKILGYPPKPTSLTTLWICILFLLSALSNGKSSGQQQIRRIVINLGDSNSDTGGVLAGAGLPIGLPHGITFFHRGTGRLGDGRLIIDFLCEHLKLGLLSPYLDSLTPNFTSGVNFAVSGAMTLPQFLPFNLGVQVRQFIHFKNRSLELISSGEEHLMDEQGFRDAVYMIDVGQNDILQALYASNLTYGPVAQKIPSFLQEIKSAIQTLYQYGARKFWIQNTGPSGCGAKELAINPHTSSDLDHLGCLAVHNRAAKTFNEGLLQLCEDLRPVLQEAKIVYVDVYSIKYELYAKHQQYGFKYPFMACCGCCGPPYNYDRRGTCGSLAYSICKNISEHIVWDGVHFTEAANRLVAESLVSGHYTIPRMKLEEFWS